MCVVNLTAHEKGTIFMDPAVKVGQGTDVSKQRSQGSHWTCS